MINFAEKYRILLHRIFQLRHGRLRFASGSWDAEAFPRAVAREALGHGRAAAHAAYLNRELLRFWGGWAEREGPGSPWHSVRIVERKDADE